MKFVIHVALCALIAIVAYVHAKQCTVDSDCTMTSCSCGYHVICEHRHEDGTTKKGGYCVCTVSVYPCLQVDDCSAIFSCCAERTHCIDSNCVCK